MSEVELLIPTNPQNLKLETLHQIGELYEKKYPKIHDGWWYRHFCCSIEANLKRHEIAKELRSITPDAFTCKEGWLKLAKTWFGSNYTEDGYWHSGYMGGLVEKCFASAFNYLIGNYKSPESVYNGMIAVINNAFPQNTYESTSHVGVSRSL